MSFLEFIFFELNVFSYNCIFFVLMYNWELVFLKRELRRVELVLFNFVFKVVSYFCYFYLVGSGLNGFFKVFES